MIFFWNRRIFGKVTSKNVIVSCAWPTHCWKTEKVHVTSKILSAMGTASLNVCDLFAKSEYQAYARYCWASSDCSTFCSSLVYWRKHFASFVKNLQPQHFVWYLFTEIPWVFIKSLSYAVTPHHTTSTRQPVNIELAAFAAERRCRWASAAVGRYLLPAWRSAANPPLLRSNDWTDRRTPDRYIDPAPHTRSMQAVPILNAYCNTKDFSNFHVVREGPLPRAPRLRGPA